MKSREEPEEVVELISNWSLFVGGVWPLKEEEQMEEEEAEGKGGRGG